MSQTRNGRFGTPRRPAPWLLLLIAMATASSARSEPLVAPDLKVDPAALARAATIYRDPYGAPHIDGPTDASVVFAFAYAQAEDYFWQIEDTYLMALGRYAEAHGRAGLNSDLLNRAFEIVPRSRVDFDKVELPVRTICAAYVAGLNYFLERNPRVKPRLITRFEPWHCLAFNRHLTLELCFRYTRLHKNFLPRMNPEIWSVTGSNGWAVAPTRTRDGHAMLFINPHQPQFGFGQFCEGHLRSGEGWNFSGATFFGSPLPGLGHNEHLGWTFTTNEPDVADAWRETFDDPKNPLRYRYDGGYRTASEWTETITVATSRGPIQRKHTFRKTHHGPIVGREDDTHFFSANIARLYDSFLIRQTMKLLRARNLDEFKAAIALNEFPIMNVVYADRRGNIFYVYNGAIPRRDPRFDWSQPVDGADPRTEWRGCHRLEELPQVLNPPTGFVQNCNSTPFTTSDDGNPDRAKFPRYMIEDRDDDKRRAQKSRQLLRAMRGVTLDDFERAAFDTGLFWAETELPKLDLELKALAPTEPRLAAAARPYLDHLLDWDKRISLDSTQAMLCAAWYEQMYGADYPGETLRPQFVAKPALKFQALIDAAKRLDGLYGTWQPRWGDVNRLQRHAGISDFVKIPFDDRLPSLPSMGGHGPMGIVLTQYYTPAINVPGVRVIKNRYAVVGATYLSVVEFGEKVTARSLLHFGQSGDPASPHFFDQAPLLSQHRLRRDLFDWDEIKKTAERTYHPGEERREASPAPAKVP